MANIPLITEKDGFEIVRDKIALILATERDLQKAEAASLGEDPSLWDFKVYIERSNPFEAFNSGDMTPVINVLYDNSSTDLAGSDLSSNQATESLIHIDIMAQAKTAATATGHAPGDEQAAREAQRVARIARQILMHGKYEYLQLSKMVGRRYMQTRTSFQPRLQTVQNILGVRLSFVVEHMEYISIEDYPVIEQMYITLKHDPEGAIIAELDLTYEGE